LTESGNFVVDDSIGISLLTSIGFLEENKKYLVITSNLYKAQTIFEYISSFLPKEEILLFPADELIRAETISASKEMMATRLYVLNSLINGSAKIVIANIASATKYLAKPELFKEKTLNLTLNSHYSIQDLKNRLTKSGYTQVNKVDQSLQYASRGDVLDIFTVNEPNPIRLEFFDDELESIRYFDIATQSSLNSISNVTILPANEFLLTDKELLASKDKIMDQVAKAKGVLDFDTFEKLRDLSEMDIDNIMDSNISPRIQRYYSFLQDDHFSIFDYAKDYVKVFVDEKSLLNSSKLLQEESWNYLSELFEKGKMISRLSIYDDISKFLTIRKNCIRTTSFLEKQEDKFFNLKPVPFLASKTLDALNIINSYLNENYTVIICTPNQEQINLLIETLEAKGNKYEMVHDFNLPNKTKLGFSLMSVPSGFVLDDEKIVYLSAKELFNERNKVARFTSKFKEATILKSFEDLEPGDYVVHEYQGIGQFVELQTLEVEGVHRDYLKIAYHGNENLFVPLSQFQLVRKYQGKEGASPRLSHLHSKDWENTKAKIKEKINDLANRLFNLYVERSKVKGFAFEKDDELQKDFESSFEFELTKDQVNSLKEIKKDMESESPMDRLLCGDVGFGKTEVAFSAIFKAILSGKQAALLCPTTLLARQHFQRAIERFSKFDIKIAIFSRLIPESKQKEYINGIENGTIHLVIGTHRLLSKDIVFKDLGLLVIDEEQRFGVEQKEKIKELKTNLDVLTLSATPIPRTLQISLLGVRSLSQINTAPVSRMPIQTYVVPFDKDVVKELIERELGRHGQAFYLHNEVINIFETASMLAKRIPNARIGVAHGQMDKSEIEEVMLKFYNGEIDVLVCTTIIENGIDIPNANLIIVEDSTKYGLSQLYQIKGRVGRGDRIAYAYLMYNGNKQLTENSQKRLKALQDFTELGSGYKIAQRDLLIRGAGDILGPEQAGFIDSIGLDMYIKLLNEAVQEKITGNKVESLPIEANTSLSIDAYIPDDFAKGETKIELYQEIVSSSSIESLSALKNKVRDMYGTLPNTVNLLFTKRNIDLLKAEADVKSMKENKDSIDLILGNRYLNIKGIGNLLFEAVIPFLAFCKISYVDHAFKIRIKKRNCWLNDLESILQSLSNIITQAKIQVEYIHEN